MRSYFRTILVFIACCSMGSYARAQAIKRSTDTDTKAKQQAYVVPKPKGPKAISRELSLGYRLNTTGWGVFTDIGRVKPNDTKHSDMFYNVRLWQIELAERKDPKEYKSTGTGGGSGSNNYRYGKINNFYALKLGRVYMRMIAGKPDPGSVSIHWLYGGGFSLGMQKPYYLNIIDGDHKTIKYDDENKDKFLNQDLIEGSAGFGKGIGEIKYIPGFHAKTAIHFDFSANRKSVIGVETGVNLEYYTQAVEIMATRPGKTLFGDLYIAVQIGKRW